jgi:hypothetical protein
MNNSLAKYLNNLSDCVIIRRDEDKIIVKAPAASNATTALFVKVYIHNNLYSRLQNARHGITFGKRDLQACVKLQEHGIQVPKPVGYCDDRPNVFSATKSLFAAQWLDSMSLAALINGMSGQTNFKRTAGANEAIAPLMEQSSFSALCSRLGGFVATLHNTEVYSKDLNVGNILIEIPASGFPEFFLTDYENICFDKPVGRKKSLNNIIQICAALMQVEESAYEDFISGYAEIRPHFNVFKLQDVIREKARRRQVLWKTKIDGNFDRIAEELKARKA